MLHESQKIKAFDFALYFALPFGIHLFFSQLTHHYLENSFLPSQKDSGLHLALTLALTSLRVLTSLLLAWWALGKMSLRDLGVFENFYWVGPLLSGAAMGVLSWFFASLFGTSHAVAFLGFSAWTEDFLFYLTPKFFFFAILVPVLVDVHLRFWTRLLRIALVYSFVFLTLQTWEWLAHETPLVWYNLLIPGPFLVAVGLSQFYGIIAGWLVLAVTTFVIIIGNYFDRLFVNNAALQVCLLVLAVGTLWFLQKHREAVRQSYVRYFQRKSKDV